MKEQYFQKRISRRGLLKAAGAAGAAGLVGCGPEIHINPTPTPLVDSSPSVGTTLEPTIQQTVAVNTPTSEPTATATAIPTETSVPTAAATSTSEPTATPETTQTSEMQILQGKLTKEIENFHGRNAVSITDIFTGETIHVNGNRAQLPGCVANLPVALAAVDGIFDMDSPVKSKEISPHLNSMVKNSNPHEGVEVVRQIGGGDVMEGVKVVNSKMEEWEMSGSFYDHPPAYPGGYSVEERSNQIVPNEMNQVLARLAAGVLFNNPNATAYALDVMSNNKPGLNFMIPLEVPESEATVYHKVGWFYGQPNTINDAGIVAANDGSFLYSIVTMHEGDEHITEEDLFQDAGLFLGKLSGIAYESFKNRYA